MPEKIIGTLTSSILKSVHTLISPIFSYKLYSVATPGHPKPLPLENHVRIIALTPDLQRVSFYSIIDFLNHSSTIKLIPSLILIKESYLGLTTMQGIFISLVAAVACRFMQDRYTGRYLGSKQVTILVSAKQPRSPHNIYAVISIIKP
jgi:hypothetical protein